MMPICSVAACSNFGTEVYVIDYHGINIIVECCKKHWEELDKFTSNKREE